MVLGTDWEFSQDTRGNTPTLTISAMGYLMTSEGQETRLTAHPKDRTQSPKSLRWGIGICFRPEERVLLLALQHHCQQHLVSHLVTDQDQLFLASEAS